MIIFDLDGTLADCEHRRHFVQRTHCYACGNNEAYGEMVGCTCMKQEFKPNWKAFYEACDQDTEIQSVVSVFHDMHRCENKVQIWSGRCESVREKTEKWLIDKVRIDYCSRFCLKNDLKMRPIGYNTPDDQLKERWLNERCSDLIEAQIKGVNPIRHEINFVFDDRPKVIRMWQRRGIFVFNCNQTGEEF